MGGGVGAGVGKTLFQFNLEDFNALLFVCNPTPSFLICSGNEMQF
jgi:hypothetical protein